MEQLKELEQTNNQPDNESTMLKVMDNYKKGVEYFNSFGLEKQKGNGHSKKAAEKKITGDGTFWDLNWFLYPFLCTEFHLLVKSKWEF